MSRNNVEGRERLDKIAEHLKEVDSIDESPRLAVKALEGKM